MYRYARNIESSSFSDLYDDLVQDFFKAVLSNLSDEVNHHKFLVSRKDINRGDQGVGADCGLECERDGQSYQVHVKVTNDGRSLKILVTPLRTNNRDYTQDHKSASTLSKIIGLYERTADEVAWNACQLVMDAHRSAGYTFNR